MPVYIKICLFNVSLAVMISVILFITGVGDMHLFWTVVGSWFNIIGIVGGLVDCWICAALYILRKNDWGLGFLLSTVTLWGICFLLRHFGMQL